MTKGKSTWKYNKLLTARRNYFLPGGSLNSVQRGVAANNPGFATEIGGLAGAKDIGQDTASTNPSNTQSGGGFNMGMASGIAGLVGQATSDILGVVNAGRDVKEKANSIIASAKNQMVGPQLSNDSLDALNEDWKNTSQIANVTRKQLGAQNFGTAIGNSFSAAARGGAAGAGLGPWGVLGGAIGGQVSSLLGSVLTNRQAKKQQKRVNEAIAEVNKFNERSLVNRADNIMNNTMSSLNAQYAAFGGPLGFGGANEFAFTTDYLDARMAAAMGKDRSLQALPNSFAGGGPVTEYYKTHRTASPLSGIFRGGFGGGRTGGGGSGSVFHNGPAEYELLKDTIYIPVERTFNDAFSEARRQGRKQFDFNGRTYTTQMGNDPASQAAGARRKEAVGIIPIEITKRKKKKAFGGELNTQGADFTNGLMYIDNGGSHESNPYEGVPMGMDQEGTPNLVEEGETIFNDYVFSKRLMVPQAIRSKYRLGGPKGISFADASKKLARESEERPNDPISMKGLEALMSDLASSQEELKIVQQSMQNPGQVTSYAAEGGRINKLALGTDDLLGLRRYVAIPDWEGSYPYGDKASNPVYSNWDNFQFGGIPLYNQDTGIYSDIYTDQKFKDWLKSDAGSSFIRNWWSNKSNAPEYYSNEKNTMPTYDDLIKGMYDSKYSDMHKFGLAALSEYKKSVARPSVTERYLRSKDKDGNLKADLITDWFDDVNDVGQTYLASHEGRKEVSRSKPVWDEKRGAFVNKIFYEDEAAKNPARHLIMRRGLDGNMIGEYSSYEDAMKQDLLNGFTLGDTFVNDNGDNVTIYNQNEPEKSRRYADWLRYSPILGSGLAVALDSAEITNKPDYSNADALAELTAGNRENYAPVRFNPIGNYLSYNPFDEQRAVNGINAQAAATRRAVLQNAGLNRGLGMSALLASDYNTQGQIGDAYVKAEEYNQALRKNVEEFNRATNMTNSEGMLKADMANQEARMKNWEMNYKGQFEAAAMRERERLAAEQARSANMSGLFTNLGNLGMDEYTRRQQDWALGKGLFGVGSEDYMDYRNNRNKPSNSANVSARGGKIKRKKKGLTI